MSMWSKIGLLQVDAPWGSQVWVLRRYGRTRAWEVDHGCHGGGRVAGFDMLLRRIVASRPSCGESVLITSFIKQFTKHTQHAH